MLFLCVSVGLLNQIDILKEQDKAPIATIKPTMLEKHGDTRIDNYYWLNDREDQEVLDYLHAENAYNDSLTAHTKDFQKVLFEEMKSRIKEDDISVPYKLNGYWYITRYETGKGYPIYARKKETLDADEEILFDCNKEAEGHSFFQMSGLSVSPDNTMISFSQDTIGRRQYFTQIKNLVTGEVYPEILSNTTGGATWAADNKSLFYTQKDPETLRSSKVFKHILGTNVTEDVEVYEEEDETFNTYVYKTKSKKYIVIGSESTLTSEYRVLLSDDPEGAFRIIQPRERGLEYSIAHFDQHFYILTNEGKATNFKVMKVGEEQTRKEFWEILIPHRNDVLIENFDIFKEYLVISERENGLNKIQIRRWDGTEEYYLPFDSETYTAYTTINPDFNTEILRYGVRIADNT